MSNLKKVLDNFEKARKDVIKELSKNVNLAGIYYEWEVKKNTPVKTWDLQNSIITWDVTNVWWKISVDVWTNLSYAWTVEYWVWRRFNYHKWENVFKTWIWARMFRDTLEEKKDNIKSIIINWW